MVMAGEGVRELARRVAEIAAGEANAQRRRLWRAHNSLRKVERAPVMCRPCGAWVELVPEESLQAVDPLERHVERQLRMRLLKHWVGDDEVFEPWVEVEAVHAGPDRPTMWGVNIETKRTGDRHGAFEFKPEIRDEADIEKLRVPRWQIDEAATRDRRDRAEELLEGTLGVRVVYGRLSGAPLAYWGAYLRGLEQMMYDCIDRPEWFGRFMRFIGEAHVEHLEGLEADGHLTANAVGGLNKAPLVCEDLPESGGDGGSMGLKDLWCEADSQEFCLVSPGQWEEFLLEYQLPIFARHGLVAYGCCESLVGKLEILRRRLPNLRRVTVSPWSDLAYSAQQCGREVVMQIRPSPTEVLMTFDEEQMRKDLEGKANVAGDTIYDFCLQDIETVGGNPEKLRTWTRIAREVGESRNRR